MMPSIAARPGYHHRPVCAQLPCPVPDSAEQEQMVQEEYTADDEQVDFFGCLGFPFLPVRRMAKANYRQWDGPLSVR
jgi:hypothetical protein